MSKSSPQISFLRPSPGDRSLVVPTTDTSAAAPSEYETLPGLLRVLRRRWLTVLSVAAVICALGIGAIFFMTPKYSATTTLEVDESDHAEDGRNASSGDLASADLKPEIETDVNILESPGLELSVIQALGLDKKRPFHAALDHTEENKPIADAPHSREQMLKVFERSVHIDSPPDTRLIKITAQNPDPVLAAQIANTLASEFIDSSLERHHRSTTQTSYWLQKELDDLKNKVEASEQKLADYERKTGMAGIQLSGSSSGDGTSSVSVSPHNTVSERLFTLNQELTAAEANRISAETVYHLVQSQDPEVVLGLGAMSVTSSNGGGSTALTSDGGIDIVRQLREQSSNLSREYAASAVKYGTNNPRLIQLQQQIDAVSQQMQAELSRIIKRAENAYLYAKKNEDTIRQEFEKQESASNVMADNTVQLQVLAQEAYSNRALYESLFSKLQTATLTSGVQAPRILVVDKALPAGSPSSPEYLKLVALIAGLGAFLGVASAFLRESLDETVRSPRQLNEPLGAPLLGYVPSISAAKLLGGSQLIEQPSSPFSESFRSMRTAVLLGLPPQSARSVLVTSAMSGEGKTTVAFNLGVALAQQGARVLLIDGDLRHPGLHELFGCALSPGLSDLVQRLDAELNEVVRHQKLPTLHLLPAGEQPELPAELLGANAFEALLQRCTSRYDFVLVDSPPILSVTDAAVIATKVGSVLAVARSGSTTRALFAGLVHSLQRTNAPILGFVLNDVRRQEMDDLQSYSYLREGKGASIRANS